MEFHLSWQVCLFMCVRESSIDWDLCYVRSFVRSFQLVD